MKWYRKTRFIHIPVSAPAYLINILALIFLTTVFLAANQNTHSVSDFFYAIFPYFVSTFLLVEWLAGKLSD